MIAVFENVINSVKEVTKICCKTYDSFTQINMHEHMNEPFCFVGIKSYKTSDKSYTNVSGTSYYNASVRVSIDLLSAKTMPAEGIVSVCDTISSLLLVSGIAISSLERKPCEFSKVHSRFLISIEFDTPATVDIRTNDSHAVMINDVLESAFVAYRIKKGVKMSSVATVSKSLLSNVVRDEPDKVTLIARVPCNEADAMVRRFSEFIGKLNSLMLGSNEFKSMTVSGIDVKADDNKTAELSVEFTEVCT